MKIFYISLIFLLNFSCSNKSNKNDLPNLFNQTRNLGLNLEKNSIGDSFSYPTGTPRVSSVIVVLNPGESFPIKKHPVPVIHNIIQGELTVEYPDLNKIITKGEGEVFISANDQWHISKNKGENKLILVGTIIGEKGTSNAIMKD